jgi:hypothetical protein
VQYRTTPGGNTTGIFLPGVAPAYLKVSRFADPSGAVFYAAFTSADGAAWTQVPGSLTSFAMPGTLLAGFGANAYSQAFSSTVVFDSLNVTAGSVPPAGLCPVAYTCTDVGGNTLGGSQNLSGTTLTVTGGGGDIWNVNDQFRFVAHALAGDGTLSAKLVSQQATNGWAKAGVMLRQTTDPGSPYYAAFATPVNGIVVQWRTVQGGTTGSVTVPGTVPAYLQVSRWTNAAGAIFYSAYGSPDGVTWTVIPGSTVALPITGPLQAGAAVTSHDTGKLSQVVFSGLAQTAVGTRPPGV